MDQPALVGLRQDQTQAYLVQVCAQLANMPMSVMLPAPLLTEREALGLFTGVLL